MSRAFHPFVALRYLSNIDGRWSTIALAFVRIFALIGLCSFALVKWGYDEPQRRAFAPVVRLAFDLRLFELIAGLAFAACLLSVLGWAGGRRRGLAWVSAGSLAGLAVLRWIAQGQGYGVPIGSGLFVGMAGLGTVGLVATALVAFGPRSREENWQRMGLLRGLFEAQIAATAWSVGHGWIMFQHADQALHVGVPFAGGLGAHVAGLVFAWLMIDLLHPRGRRSAFGWAAFASTGLALATSTVVMLYGIGHPVSAHAATLDQFNIEGHSVATLTALASRQTVTIAFAACAVMLGFWVVITGVRRIFSFNSTVSIGGVWIGTMALIVVLSVMNGFEGDLRNKILGSNAHIQITREEGEFVDWEPVRAKIDQVPGVTGSSPFATSEVVIAANQNYYNVIIKGIDRASIDRVSKLSKTLRDPTALDRLEPLDELDDIRTRDVQPPTAPAAPTTAPMDPAPADVPDDFDDAEPIDLSGGAAPTATDPAEEPDADTVGDPASLDPAPPEFFARDDEPFDLSQADAKIDEGQDTVEIDYTPGARTRTLPGVLVGEELTRQIYLYLGQEVRMVSPLSDPSNPDATGTPIPFSRDYRVAGVFYSGMYEYDLKFVYVSLDSLQQFLDRGDEIDGIEVRISDPNETGDVVARLRKVLGPTYRVADWQELNRSLFSALKLEKIAMFMVLGIIILVASFSILGNLVMVVIEKGKQIALLKTLGATNRDIVVIFVLQGFIIGLVGTALGVGIGLGICGALIRWGLPIDPEVYYIDKLPVMVDLTAVSLVALASVLVSVAATLYPALVAARLRPSAGLRH